MALSTLKNHGVPRRRKRFRVKRKKLQETSFEWWQIPILFLGVIGIVLVVFGFIYQKFFWYKAIGLLVSGVFMVCICSGMICSFLPCLNDPRHDDEENLMLSMCPPKALQTSSDIIIKPSAQQMDGGYLRPNIPSRDNALPPYDKGHQESDSYPQENIEPIAAQVPLYPALPVIPQSAETEIRDAMILNNSHISHPSLYPALPAITQNPETEIRDSMIINNPQIIVSSDDPPRVSI